MLQYHDDKPDTSVVTLRKSKWKCYNFERDRTIGMHEAGWSYRALGRHMYHTVLVKMSAIIIAARYSSAKSRLWKAMVHECKAKSDEEQ